MDHKVKSCQINRACGVLFEQVVDDSDWVRGLKETVQGLQGIQTWETLGSSKSEIYNVATDRSQQVQDPGDIWIFNGQVNDLVFHIVVVVEIVLSS